ncbi:MAG: hypothetical protein ACREPM_10625 [Gemmatimonadaceae bacterium]
MRTIRALAIAAVVVVALPNIGGAQRGAPFTDSWFWGIKTGGFTLADSGQHYVQAPMVGIDWLITRTHGGLYVAGSQTWFSQHTFTLQDPTSQDSGLRPVLVKNLRRLDVAVMGFPGEHLKFHPYAGLGFTLEEVSTVQAEGTFSNDDQIAFAEQVIADEKVTFSPLLMIGGQWRLTRVSVFGQLTASPAQKQFILYNGKPFNFGYEIGVRYNFGTSIDRN